MQRYMNMVLSIVLVMICFSCHTKELAAQVKPQLNTGSRPPWVTREVNAPRVQHHVFYSTAAGTKVSYHVFLPKSYDKEEEQRFPVLYWLHGRNGGLPGIRPVSHFFDTAIQQGLIPPMIIVFPNGRAGSMWCDAKDGSVPMETVVIKELIPLVDKAFRTIAERNGRLVEGFSMGGYGAARFGFKYPEEFCAISLLGAGPMQRVFSEDIGPAYMSSARKNALKDVYGGDQAYFQALSPWILAEKSKDVLRMRPLVRIAVGSLDGTLQFNREFHEHLAKLGIRHSFSVLPGVKHDALGVLSQLGVENWEFYRSALGWEGSGEEKKDPAQQGTAPDADKRRR